jgi:hypothetical protein
MKLGKNATVGERALREEGHRTASVVAHRVTVCMCLSKVEF